MMWGISCFFNPCRYPNKLENLKVFRDESKHQGLKLILVELAFGDTPFEVPQDCAEIIIRLRTNSVLWHKERLLNIALQSVPSKNVAWIDADVMLENENWIESAEHLLETYPVVQLFERAEWLSPTGDVIQQMDSTAAQQARKRDTAGIYGHAGFGWAARTEILKKHGFYDRNVIGGGNGVMAWAMYRYAGLWPGEGFHHIFLSDVHREHVEQWSARFFEDVQGRVGCVPGAVRHLWHGAIKDRFYLDRHVLVANEQYNPLADIRIAENECLEWASDKPELHRSVREYFLLRAEGG